MKKSLVSVFAISLLLLSAGMLAAAPKPAAKKPAAAAKKSAYAAPWMTSYNTDGQMNLYGSVGFYNYGGAGITLNAGPEFIIKAFDLGGIPLQVGAEVRGLVGFASYSYSTYAVSDFEWAVAPMATIHFGADFGTIWKFDWYVGLGLSIYGDSYTYSEYPEYNSHYGPLFAFASADGISWNFSKNIGLIIDYTTAGWVSSYGLGVKVAL